MNTPQKPPNLTQTSSIRWSLCALLFCWWAGSVQAGNTALVIDSPAGDYIGQGKSYYFTPTDGSFMVQNDGPGSVVIVFQSPFGPSSESWRVSFGSADGTLLQPGTYNAATRYPFNIGTGRPGLDISGDSRGCNQENGSFTIDEISYGANDVLIAFHASFQQSCEGNDPPLRGEIFYNATTIPPPRNHITSALTAFGAKGRAFNYRITGSTNEVSFSASNLPKGLTVNSTSGVISGKPAVSGSFTVKIAAADTTSKATASLQVKVGGVSNSPGPHTAIWLSSEPGQWVGNGEDQLITPNDGPINGTGNSNGSFAKVSYDSSKAGGFWTLQFGGPGGLPLSVGHYPTNGSGSSGDAYMDVSGDGRGCSLRTGSFDIKEIEFDTSGQLERLHATFEQHCEGSTSALHGTVWFNATQAIVSSPFIAAKVNKPFTYQIVANNAPVSFTATNLPPGVSIDSTTGRISGTPSVFGEFRITIDASNGDNHAVDDVFLDVAPTPLKKKPVITISVSPAQIMEGESTTFTVHSSVAPIHDLPLQYITIVGGTTTLGFSITPEQGHITIPAGQTSASIVLTSFNDTVAEPAETVTLRLAGQIPNVPYKVGSQNKATVTILDVP